MNSRIRSELVDQVARQRAELAKVNETEIVHIRDRHASHVFWLHATQVVDKAIRGAIVALIDLRARQKRCLVAVRFIAQEIFGEELLNEALQPVAAATCVRVRNGKASLTDGPYAETKEMVAGFYLIEARDLNEAIQVASRLPSAPLGTIEVRPCRDLEVDGVAYKASRKSAGRSFQS